MILTIVHTEVVVLAFWATLYYLWHIWDDNEKVDIVEYCVALIEPLLLLGITGIIAWGIYTGSYDEKFSAINLLIFSAASLATILVNAFIAVKKYRAGARRAFGTVYWTVCVYVWLMIGVECFFYFLR